MMTFFAVIGIIACLVAVVLVAFAMDGLNKLSGG